MTGSRVQIGTVRTAHGVRGAVAVAVSEHHVERLGELDALFVGGQRLAIEGIAGTSARPIISFTGIDDRNAAERLRGAAIEVEREALGPLGDEEFFHGDLEGLDVILDDGSRTVGKIRRVLALPTGDALEVRGAGGATAVIPFTRDAVPQVDVTGGRVVVSVEFCAEVLEPLTAAGEADG